jgi:hypothetical protein
MLLTLSEFQLPDTRESLSWAASAILDQAGVRKRLIINEMFPSSHYV